MQCNLGAFLLFAQHPVVVAILAHDDVGNQKTQQQGGGRQADHPDAGDAVFDVCRSQRAFVALFLQLIELLQHGEHPVLCRDGPEGEQLMRLPVAAGTGQFHHPVLQGDGDARQQALLLEQLALDLAQRELQQHQATIGKLAAAAGKVIELFFQIDRIGQQDHPLQTDGPFARGIAHVGHQQHLAQVFTGDALQPRLRLVQAAQPDTRQEQHEHEHAHKAERQHPARPRGQAMVGWK